MKRKWSPVTMVCLFLAVALVGVVAWRFTWGNAGWRIRQVFPGAKPYVDFRIDRTVVIPRLVRVVIPSYYRADEPLGFGLSDSREPIDLQQRFSRLADVRFVSARFVRCRIAHLCPTNERGFPDFVFFDRCDFSQLTAEERARLHAYGPIDSPETVLSSIGRDVFAP